MTEQEHDKNLVIVAEDVEMIMSCHAMFLSY